MILYVLLCIVLVFFLFKKEGFKEGAEPAEPVNDIQQLKDTISELDKRLTKIEKDISDFADT